MKKPKRRTRRKPIRMPGLPATFATETEASDMLAGMMRARLALMPPPLAEDYRGLAQRDNLTLAEKAKVNRLEDAYAPSRQQIQAAIAEAHADMKRSRKAAR